MKHFSDALIEDIVDIASVKQFYNSLKNKYIDADAFHKAFDQQIIAANLNDIFDTSSGLLKTRGTYGKIKDCQDIDLQKALKKLWAAQYVDNITTKDLQAKRDAQRKAWEEEQAKRQAEQERIQAEKEAARKALEAENKAFADECKGKALDYLKSENSEIFDIYKKIMGEDIENVVAIEPKVSGDKNIVRFWVSVGHSYYDCTRADIEDSARIAKYFTNLLGKAMKNKLEADIKETYSNIANQIGLTDRDWSCLYFLDKTTNQIYRYGHWNDERHDTDKLVIYRQNNNTTYVDDVKYNEMPEINNLELVVIDNLISYSSGRCWSDSTINTYYKPEVDTNILHRCGVALKKISGGFNEASVRALPDDQIPENLKALGFTKAEQTDFAYDSSD